MATAALPLLGVGSFVVLIGMVLCTDRVEQWHERRRLPVTQATKPRPRTSGCRDCGMEDLPLNTQRVCWVCADLADLKAGVT